MYCKSTDPINSSINKFHNPMSLPQVIDPVSFVNITIAVGIKKTIWETIQLQINTDLLKVRSQERRELRIKCLFLA